MNYARRLARELSARRKPKAQHQKMLRRALFSEPLEPRSMMAADLGNSDYWNADKPCDVNGDGMVSTIDAVLVINRLRGEFQPLAPIATMEGETSVGNRYVDVNNDWQVSTIDALLVINRLNSPPEAERLVDDTVNYEVRLLQAGTDNLLSANTVGFNGEFDMQLRVQDLHKDLGPKGVVQAFADILITNKDLIEVQVAEVQTIEISDPSGGSFTLTFRGETTAPINVTGTNAAANQAIMTDIRNKLGALSTVGGVDNIAVTRVLSVSIPPPVGQWQIRFVGDFYNVNVDPLTGSFTPPGGSPEDVAVTSADPTSAEAFREAFRSINLSGVGVDEGTYLYQRGFDATTDVDGRFNDVGAGLTDLQLLAGSGPQELARVRLRAKTTAGQVGFQPNIVDVAAITQRATFVSRESNENPIVVAVDTAPRAVGSSISAATTAATGRVVAGASASTFSVTAFGTLGGALSSVDGFYNGARLRISSGTLNGQSQIVQDYNGATKTFTFVNPFTAAPAANVNIFVDGSVTVPSLIGSSTPPQRGEFIKITSGALSDRTAEITSYDNTTGQIGYEVPFSTTLPVLAPAIGDTLQIHENVRGTATDPDSITLTIVSGPIQVVDDPETVVEDSVANILDVLDNDSTTPAGGTKTVVSVSASAKGGTVAVGAGGNNVIYTPPANFASIGADTDTFTYVARNLSAGATSQTETATVTVTVTGVNDAPTLNAIANPAPISDNAGQQMVNLSGIDEGGGVDENTQSLVFSVTSSNTALVPTPPAIVYTQDSGTAVLNFTPNPNALGAAASGTAVITVTVTDDGSNTTPNVNTFSRSFTVTVNATNDPPVNQKGGAALAAGASVAATLGEAFQFQGPDLLAVIDLDSDNVSTTVTLTGGAAGGNLTATGGSTPSGTSITFSGTKAAVNAGLATLVYNQPAGNTSFATATLTVTTTDQGNPTPNATDMDTVLININPPQGPFARDEQLSGLEDAGPYDLDVLDNDFANPPATTLPTLETVTLVGVQKNGAISPAPAGVTAVLLPAGDPDEKSDDLVRVTVPQHFNSTEFGDIIVDYTISEDPTGPQTLPNDTGRLTFTVTPQNDQPVAVDDLLYEVAIGGTLTVGAASGVLANDTDVDAGDTKTVVIPPGGIPVSGTAAGTLSMNPDGSFTFTPTGTAGGDVSFTYTVRDSGGLTDEGLAKIHIAPRPTADNDSYTVTEGMPMVVNAANGVLFGDMDQEQPPATLTATPTGTIILSPATAGSVTLNPDGSFTYNPSADFFGTASFVYRASANGRESLDAVVTFTVVEDNDAPVAGDDLGPDNDANGTPDGITIIKLFTDAQRDQVIDVLVNDTDPDNLDGITGNEDTLDIQSVDATGANGTVTIRQGTNGTRDVLLYTPNDGFVGTASFTYTVTDGEDTDTAVVKVNVVEFQPKTISGFIFTDKLLDGELNHTPDEGERVFAGIEVRLAGTDFVTKQPLSQIDPRTGEEVPYLIAYTDANGQYTFENVAPPDDGTSYTLSAATPTFFRDGLEFNMVDSEAGSLVEISGGTFQLAWAVNDTSGDLIGLNFTVGNLNTSLLGIVPKAEEVRTSTPNAPDASLGFYLLVAADGSVTVVKSLMEGHPLEGWDGLDAGQIEIVDMTGVQGSSFTIYPTLTLLIHGQEVTMVQQPQLNGGSSLDPRFRLYGDPNGDHIIRVAGSADDFGITLAAAEQVPNGAEGEAASYPNYVQGADEVFTGQSWA